MKYSEREREREREREKPIFVECRVATWSCPKSPDTFLWCVALFLLHLLSGTNTITTTTTTTTMIYRRFSDPREEEEEEEEEGDGDEDEGGRDWELDLFYLFDSSFRGAISRTAENKTFRSENELTTTTSHDDGLWDRWNGTA